MVLMTGPSIEAKHSMGRRTLLKSGLLAGVGLAVAGTVSLANEGKALATDWNNTAIFNGKTYNLTSEGAWAQCQLCAVLFVPSTVYYGTEECDGGICASDNGKHVGNETGGNNASGVYYVPLTKDGAPSMQSSWLHCTQCKTLFNGTGFCPAFSVSPEYSIYHTGGTTSRNYDMMYASGDGWSPGNMPIQARWRWCSLCHNIYYSNNVPQACAGNPGAGHTETGTLNYYLFKEG
jgi:hypothetical protein